MLALGPPCTAIAAMASKLDCGQNSADQTLHKALKLESGRNRAVEVSDGRQNRRPAQKVIATHFEAITKSCTAGSSGWTTTCDLSAFHPRKNLPVLARGAIEL